nr:SDR family oxidoreductase [Xanthomonas euroxanthea]
MFQPRLGGAQYLHQCHVGAARSSIYAATKAALLSMTKTLSGELLARGIRLNAVGPGPVETPLYDKLGIADAYRAQLCDYLDVRSNAPGSSSPRPPLLMPGTPPWPRGPASSARWRRTTPAAFSSICTSSAPCWQTRCLCPRKQPMPTCRAGRVACLPQQVTLIATGLHRSSQTETAGLAPVFSFQESGDGNAKVAGPNGRLTRFTDVCGKHRQAVEADGLAVSTASRAATRLVRPT